jgi:hypothetical protein
VLLALKAVMAYLPVDRDARSMADEIRHAMDLHGIEEIAFVDMRGFFGLTLYLDVHVESVRVGGPQRAHSRWVASDEELCDEIGEREANVYAMKRQRTGRFIVAVAGCGPYGTLESGHFHGDGEQIALLRVVPRDAGG